MEIAVGAIRGDSAIIDVAGLFNEAWFSRSCAGITFSLRIDWLATRCGALAPKRRKNRTGKQAQEE